PLSRRRFLQASAGVVGFWGAAAAADRKPSANERLQVGVIGVAGQGEANWKGAAGAGAAIVALCDVDEKRTAEVRKKYPKATVDADLRRLLGRKGIDAVLISTPDHTHAPIAMAALKSGRHVYCEKPLTHTVHEARLVARTAAQRKLVTQLGTQIHAGNNYRRV